MLLQLKELANEVLFRKTQGLQLAEDLLEYLQKKRRSPRYQRVDALFCCRFCGSKTLSNLVLSATSRSEADMLPMSSSEEDWERRLLEPCTFSLFKLEVEPVSFPELPWRPIAVGQNVTFAPTGQKCNTWSQHFRIEATAIIADISNHVRCI